MTSALFRLEWSLVAIRNKCLTCWTLLRNWILMLLEWGMKWLRVVLCWPNGYFDLINQCGTCLCLWEVCGIFLVYITSYSAVPMYVFSFLMLVPGQQEGHIVCIGNNMWWMRDVLSIFYIVWICNLTSMTLVLLKLTLIVKCRNCYKVAVSFYVMSYAAVQFCSWYHYFEKNRDNLLTEAGDIWLWCCMHSFHVGSGCYDAVAYSAAVMSARAVFDMAEIAGFHFNLLDIGGGFPGQASSKPSFDEVSCANWVLRYNLVVFCIAGLNSELVDF